MFPKKRGKASIAPTYDLRDFRITRPFVDQGSLCMVGVDAPKRGPAAP